MTEQEQIDNIMQLYSIGDMASVENAARNLTNSFPKTPFGWKLLGVSLAVKGSVTDSISAFRKLVALTPSDHEAHGNFAIAFSTTVISPLRHASNSAAAALPSSLSLNSSPLFFNAS